MQGDGGQDRIGLLALGLASTAAFGLYALFGQHTFYLADGLQLVYHFLLKGNVAHDIHPLYLPVVDGFHDALRFTGLGAFRIATLCSALSTAAGLYVVGLLGRASGLSRGATLLLLALVGLCPAVFFFATVVEFHGFFFLFACICFWATEGLFRARGWRRYATAALLGLTTFVASLAHSTGSLLVPLVGTWVAARGGLRQRLLELCLFSLVHVSLLRFGRPLVLGALGLEMQSAHTLTGWLEEWLRAEGVWSRALSVIGHEILLPFLPLCMVFGLPLLAPGSRRSVLWLAVGSLPYYLLCVLVLADRVTGQPIHERGAYMLPLAIPAAWLVAYRLHPSHKRVAAALLALSLAGSVLQVRAHDVRPGKEYGEAVRSILDERETILLAGTRELPWILVEAPSVRPFYLVEGTAVDPAALAPWLGATQAAIDALLAEGARVLLSDGARQDLLDPRLQPQGRMILDSLSERYVRRPVRSGAFSAEELAPRP